MSVIRYLGVPFAALIVAAAVPSSSFAACAQDVTFSGDLQVANDLVKNSEDATLRNAHRDNRCVITKGLHNGGVPCADKKGEQHVTLFRTTPGGAKMEGTYHVFNFKINDRQCTTRK